MYQSVRLPVMFRLRDLGTAGLNSKAMSINDNCIVVGSIEPKIKAYHVSMVPNGFISSPTSYSTVKRVLPYAINNHDQIVGAWFSKNDLAMPQSVMFTLSRKKRLLVIPSSKTTSSAISINDNGTVLGYTIGNGIHSGGSVFVGKPHSLEFMPKDMPAALRIMNLTKINNSNFLSGTRYSSSGFLAILVHDKSVHDLQLPTDCGSSSAIDLNDENQAVGFSVKKSGPIKTIKQSEGSQIPTLWNHDNAINIFDNLTKAVGVDPHANAQAFAINNTMAIVGRATDMRGKHCGFFWKNGQVYNLNYCLSEPSEWDVIDAMGINSHDQIIAWGMRRVDGIDERHALLLEPCN